MMQKQNTLGVILGNGRCFGMRACDRMKTFGVQPPQGAGIHRTVEKDGYLVVEVGYGTCSSKSSAL